MVDVVHRPYTLFFVTQVVYNMEKPVKFFAQIRLLERKKEKELFQKIVIVEFKLEDLIHMLDIMKSAYNKDFSFQTTESFL